ncbi:MAG: rod-binding protein [Bdellovibrionales bacterium]
MKIDRALPMPNAHQDPAEKAAKQDGQLREAAKMYEQHFIREMVKAMRQASPEGGLMEPSFGEKIYREQLDNQYVDAWSGRGGVGLADMIYNHVRERYFPGAQNMAAPKGPLPLKQEGGAQKGDWQAKPLPLNNGTPAKKDLSLRFEGENLSPEQRVVQAPWAGKVSQAFNTENGLSLVEIEHDQGLVSRLVFAGAVDGRLNGQQVQAGAKLGQVQGSAPWLQWQMERV